MSDSGLILFSLPELTAPKTESTTACFVDAIGMVFETAHAIFDREPELFEVLSVEAILVPLYALETASKQNEPSENALVSFLFSNLDYPFSQHEFAAYLSDSTPLPSYTEAVHPQGSFWRAIAQGARPEEFKCVMTALHHMLSAVDASSDDVLQELCQTCNLERMNRYCREAKDVERVCAELAACYDKAMEGSGDVIQTEERDFMLHALVLYSIWEMSDVDCFARIADTVPMALAISIHDFAEMMVHSESRQTLDELFACTNTAAGGFWKTLYAAARQAGAEELVAAVAANLEALLRLLCSPSDRLAQHRERLFALVS